MLEPLTKLTSNKVKFKWTEVEQRTFKSIILTVDCNNLLAYPGFNKLFEIHTYSSNFQIEAVIIQEVNTIAFYSRKLNRTQKGYTVTET